MEWDNGIFNMPKIGASIPFARHLSNFSLSHVTLSPGAWGSGIRPGLMSASPGGGVRKEGKAISLHCSELPQGIKIEKEATNSSSPTNSRPLTLTLHDNSIVQGNFGKRLNLLVGARGFEPPTPWTPFKCATRLRYAPTEKFSLS